MFLRNKINFIYRMLCLLSYLFVIIFINSNTTLIIIAISFFALTIMEKRFENYFLYAITMVVFIICLTMKNYFLLRIITIINYIHYFLNVDSLDDFDEIEENIKRDEHYIRFRKKEERKTSNNKLCTVFVLVHMVLLLVAIVIG